MKLDILAIAAHPDDVELGASGTLVKHQRSGKKVGIVDLTRGELGTRGTAELRDEEAARSADILKLDARINLRMPDGFFSYSRENQILIIEQIRRFKPDVVLCNAIKDRHPDHGKGSVLTSDAVFLSGLRKIETSWDGQQQEAWRPKMVYHYIQDHYIKPDFIVDISDEWATKMASIHAFSSQFYDPNSNEPQSPISSREFMDNLEGRALQYGRLIGSKYGEGFTTARPIGVNSLFDLV